MLAILIVFMFIALPVKAEDASANDIALQPLTVRYVNIGNGDCIILECDGHYAMIDAGKPSATSGKVETPEGYPAKLGITHFDYIFLTHPHADHIGKTVRVINRYQCDKVLVGNYSPQKYKKISKAIKKAGGEYVVVSTGDTYSLGDAEIEILYVPNGTISSIKDSTNTKYNNSSVIIKITHGQKTFLFLGDAEIAEQQKILELGIDIKCDVLKVPHHGYINAYVEGIYEKAKPQTVVVSASKLKNIKKNGKLVEIFEKNYTYYHTYRDGTVTLVSDGTDIRRKYTVKQAVKTVDTSVNAITLGIREKYRLCVTPDVPTTDKFYFESSAKNICSVDQKGLIKAKKTEGSATITIYAYDKKSEKKNRPVASVDVKVESKEATEVSVTDASINYLGNKELYVGEMGYISTLINGGANNGGAAVKYTMDNKGIVKIDTYGHVTAKKTGTVTITATCGEKTDSVTLTVKQPLKLYKVNKSYVKIAAPKAGKSSKKVTFNVKTNPTAKKFTDGGGRVTWTVTSKDTGISLKSDDGKGKAVFEVHSGASDTIVTATINDPVTGKTYSTDCMIDVK